MCVCALISSQDSSDGSSRDGSQRPGGPAKLRRCADSWVEKLGLLAVSNDGAGNCMFEAPGQAFAKAGKTPTDARTVRTAVVAKMMILGEIFKPVFCGTDGAGEPCTWRRYCTGMRKDGVWQRTAGCRGALESSGQATVLVGKGERIVWLKLESRHDEFLASDNSEEFGAARGAHIKEIAEIYKMTV